MTDDVEGWHSVDQYPDARQVPGIVVYRWEAPLFFANAGIFRKQVRELVRDREPRWIVLQCEAITDVDVTAAAMLSQLDNELNAAGRPPRVRRAPRPATGSRRPLRPARDARPRPLLPDARHRHRRRQREAAATSNPMDGGETLERL